MAFCIARPIRFVVGLALNTYDDDDDDGRQSFWYILLLRKHV